MFTEKSRHPSYTDWLSHTTEFIKQFKHKCLCEACWVDDCSTAVYGPHDSCVFPVCVLLRRAGRRSITCQEERRRSALWRWCLHCITSSPRRSTSWTRSMLPSTSRTSPSWLLHIRKYTVVRALHTSMMWPGIFLCSEHTLLLSIRCLIMGCRRRQGTGGLSFIIQYSIKYTSYNLSVSINQLAFSSPGG